MKKPTGKKGRKSDEVKEDSKQDLIFANYLIEDITAFEGLIPANEKEAISEDKISEILEAVKKIKVRK